MHLCVIAYNEHIIDNLMEEDNSNSTKIKVETDYSSHEENPGPAKKAVEEKSDKRVGNTIKWVILIAVIALAIAYFFFM